MSAVGRPHCSFHPPLLGAEGSFISLSASQSPQNVQVIVKSPSRSGHLLDIRERRSIQPQAQRAMIQFNPHPGHYRNPQHRRHTTICLASQLIATYGWQVTLSRLPTPDRTLTPLPLVESALLLKRRSQSSPNKPNLSRRYKQCGPDLPSQGNICGLAFAPPRPSGPCPAPTNAGLERHASWFSITNHNFWGAWQAFSVYAVSHLSPDTRTEFTMLSVPPESQNAGAQFG